MSENLRPCSNPNCGNTESKTGEFKNCSRCKKSCYCSKDCQVSHWKGSHKNECRAPDAAEDAGTSVQVPKEFIDLQEKYKGDMKVMARLEARELSLSKEIRRNELTLNEVNPLSSECPLYRSIGTMFLRMPKADLIQDVALELEKQKKDRESCAGQLEYLSRQQKTRQSELNEMYKSLSRD